MVVPIRVERIYPSATLLLPVNRFKVNYTRLCPDTACPNQRLCHSPLEVCKG